MKQRCDWAQSSKVEEDYHDHEWGVPQFDETKLFEFLILEGAQAGLSWRTVLLRRENYRHALEGFDPNKLAHYDAQKIQSLLANPGLIRNRLKIESLAINARAFLGVQDSLGSFKNYLWGYVDGEPIVNHWRSQKEVPAETPLAQKMSKDLKNRGFKFVGPTIIYAYLQAVGVVNDHLVKCFRHREILDS